MTKKVVFLISLYDDMYLLQSATDVVKWNMAILSSIYFIFPSRSQTEPYQFYQRAISRGSKHHNHEFGK